MPFHGRSNSRRCATSLPEATTVTEVTPCSPSSGEFVVGPVTPEKSLEKGGLAGMEVRNGENSDSNRYHGKTTIVTLPVGVEPSFLYHGRTRSYFPGSSDGVSEVSRNSKGLSFDPGDTGVADGILDVKRKLVQTKNGPAYEYEVSFKREIIGDRYQTGAWDPEKLAIRVNGTEYEVKAKSTSTPPITLPTAPAPSLVMPKPPSGKPGSDTKIPDEKGPAPMMPEEPKFPPLPKGGPLGGAPTPDPEFPKITPGGPAPVAPKKGEEPALPKVPKGGPAPEPALFRPRWNEEMF